MRKHSHMPRRRPRWWPEDEAWPPSGPPSHAARAHFMRRMGCVFGFFFLSVLAFMLLGLWNLVQWFSQNQPPEVVRWLAPVSVVFFFAVLFIWVRRGLRRFSIPMGDLLEASDRVAQGDYAARAREDGPRELRSLVRAFNGMAARLQENDARRRGLLADVTHELRTPLTVIQGNLEGMLDGVYPADEAQLKSLLDETHLLSRLVDDLRTLALAESGALLLKKEPTDLALLIGETAAAFRSRAETGQVRLELNLPSAAPLIDLDPARLREVLSNLLLNALHYTPPGGLIQVRLAFDGETGGQTVIEVQDSGAGISPEDLPHVFERFYKARDSGGMGLGLAIAKGLVEAHGGTISAHSAPGEGTVVRVSLPVS